MWGLMFPQTLAPFILTLIRRANVDNIEYQYKKDRLERKVENRQLQEAKGVNEFFIWLYKTLICMIGTAISVCAGEIYRLSFVSKESVLFAYVIVITCITVLIIFFIKICFMLMNRIVRKFYGN